MKSNNQYSKKLLTELFAQADIQIGGNRKGDLIVHDDRFYDRTIRYGDLGIGEAYMDAWWDCDGVDVLATKFIKADLQNISKKQLPFIMHYLKIILSGNGRKGKAFEVGEHHYDMSTEIFEYMLDKTMAYSCAYWKDAENLEQAQENKLDVICKKLGLREGMTVLDVGCGWGSFAHYAAKNYGVEIVGITVSQEQQRYAQKRCENLKVDIRFQDYRDITEKFDRIVSIAMLEAVGKRYYKTFMKSMSQCLNDDGLLFIHSIVAQTHQGPSDARWLDTYIFPNGELPSLAQILKASEKLFVIEDTHNLEGDYDRTLGEWHKNFLNNWDTLKENYDERFFRMWVFYLLICRGIFRSRLATVWHIVFSKNGLPCLPSSESSEDRSFVHSR